MGPKLTEFIFARMPLMMGAIAESRRQEWFIKLYPCMDLILGKLGSLGTRKSTWNSVMP